MARIASLAPGAAWDSMTLTKLVTQRIMDNLRATLVFADEQFGPRRPLSRWENLRYGPLYNLTGRFRHVVANAICAHEDGYY